MAELLLELLTEEIPARMQAVAAEELRRLAEVALDEAHLRASRLVSFVTPRRLTLLAEGLPATQPGSREERRGPRVGAPEAAVQGFLKSAGLSSLDQCEKRATDKGEFYFAVIERVGQVTAEILPGILRTVIEALPWPKSMRFPAAPFRWVRPIESVIAILDNRVLKLDLGDIPVGMTTRGHRFLSKAHFSVRNFADYRKELRDFHVVLDAGERRAMIAEGLAAEAAKAGVRVKEDEALLDEVTGLVEWPVVLMGRIEPEFMALPAEVLTTSMRTHQKYFACLDEKGALAPRFLLVANMIAEDGGKAIIAGNERVLRARLSDAKFFWDQDRKATLESRVPKLKERVFYSGLGSMAAKVSRMQRLGTELTQILLRNPQWLLARKWPVKVTRPNESFVEAVNRVILLAKTDLTTGMVGEFPELQGIMGRYYSQCDGELEDVARSIQDHYLPQGQTDELPGSPYGVIAALTDKIDTLVGFFAIGEKPTGSKDPFALRRAALGTIRLILDFGLRISLKEIVRRSLDGYLNESYPKVFKRFSAAGSKFGESVVADLLDFFADRLKVALRDQGVRHDLIAAVFALGEDDLVRLRKRVDALGSFLASEDGANLLIAYRRAANIVRIEEGKDKARYSDAPDRDLFELDEERALDRRLRDATTTSQEALKGENFAGAMAALAALRAPVDEFFNKVTVNVPGNTEESRALRVNRLRLLSQIRDTLNRVADFSQIEG